MAPDVKDDDRDRPASTARTRVGRRPWLGGSVGLSALAGLVALAVLAQPPSPPPHGAATPGATQTLDPMGTAGTAAPGPGSTSTPDTLQRLRGQWRVVSVTGQGNPTLAKTPPTFTFGDAHFTAQPGCNGLGQAGDGAYRVVEGRLVVDDLVSTAMACSDQSVTSQERWFTSLIRQNPTVAFDDAGRLVLVAGGVRSEAVRVVPAPSVSGRDALIGTAWTVERLPGGPITGTVLARRPWLRLAADGTMEGHDGCASFTGRWYRDGEDVRFDDLKRDAKPCPSVSSGLDFLGALQASTRSHHTDTSLVLSDAGGIERLRFHPVTDTGGPAPTTVQVRVANASGKDIARVDLLQGRTRVSFGAVKNGAAALYQPVAGVVYRYTGFDVTFSDGTHQ